MQLITMDRWMDIKKCTYTVEYSQAIKMNESFVRKWMQLETLMLDEIYQHTTVHIPLFLLDVKSKVLID